MWATLEVYVDLEQNDAFDFLEGDIRACISNVDFVRLRTNREGGFNGIHVEIVQGNGRYLGPPRPRPSEPRPGKEATFRRLLDTISMHSSVERVCLRNHSARLEGATFFCALINPDARWNIRSLEVNIRHNGDVDELDKVLRHPDCQLVSLRISFGAGFRDFSAGMFPVWSSALSSPTLKILESSVDFQVNPVAYNQFWGAEIAKLIGKSNSKLEHFGFLQPVFIGRDDSPIFFQMLVDAFQANKHILNIGLAFHYHQAFFESARKICLCNLGEVLQNSSAAVGIRMVHCMERKIEIEVPYFWKSRRSMWKPTEKNTVQNTLLYFLIRSKAGTEIMDAAKAHFCGVESRKRKFGRETLQCPM